MSPFVHGVEKLFDAAHGPVPAKFLPLTLKYHSPVASVVAGVTEHDPVPDAHPAADAVHQTEITVVDPVPTQSW